MKFRKHAYYRVGADKLQEELDVVSLIKAIRQVKVMKGILLNRLQNTALKFQQKDVIESSSESSELEGGNINIISLVHHKNQAIKTFYTNKINSLFDQYKSKDFKLIDKKILKGILKLSHFDDDILSSGESEEMFDASAIDNSINTPIVQKIRK